MRPGDVLEWAELLIQLLQRFVAGELGLAITFWGVAVVTVLWLPVGDSLGARGDALYGKRPLLATVVMTLMMALVMLYWLVAVVAIWRAAGQYVGPRLGWALLRVCFAILPLPQRLAGNSGALGGGGGRRATAKMHVAAENSCGLHLCNFG